MDLHNDNRNTTSDQAQISMLVAALRLVEQGFHVFPVHNPIPDGRCSCGEPNCKSVGKHPRVSDWPHQATTDPEQIRQWYTQWPDANIGIATGPSGCVVIDVDGKDGLKELADFLRQHGMKKIPETPVSKTGREGGAHIFFRSNGVELKNRTDVLKGVDVRANGGYVVAPTSLHQSGKRYRWADNRTPTDSPVAEIPSCFAELILGGKSKKKKRKGTPADRTNSESEVYREGIPEGTRNQTLAEIAGAIRYRGGSVAGIEAALLAINSVDADPQLGPDEIASIARSIGTRDTGSCPRFESCDLGNARRLVLSHGRDLRYCSAMKGWLVWDGARWVNDETGEVERKAKLTAETIAGEARVSSNEEKLRKTTLAWGKKSQSRAAIKNMVELAKTESDITITPDKLDANPMLFNVKNGTIDLRTGDFCEHNRADLITKMAAVEYDPNSDCPKWERFISTIMGGNPERISFLQRACGSILAKRPDDQALLILYGAGQNGKTVLLETMRSILSDYAVNLTPESLMAKRGGGGIPNDIARLRGGRFVTAAETDYGQRFSESTIKRLTGGDQITARKLYQEHQEFRFDGRIWLATNDLPEISTDSALRRRIVVIPFDVRIRDDEVIPGLAETLFREEASGILNWMLCGYHQYWEIGLCPPNEMVERTNDYFDDQDSVALFLQGECCVQPENEELWESSTAIWNAYSKFCKENHLHAVTQNALSRRLSESGLRKQRSGERRGWQGISVVSTN